MKHELNPPRLGRLVLALTLALIIVATGSVAGAVTPQRRHLSLTNVTIGGGETSEAYYPYFVAQAKGYYKQAGLNVSFVQSLASGADLAAAMVSGAFTFAVVPAQATTIAEQGGGPIRGVMANGYGATDELAVSQAAATADNIPSTGLAAQTRALKGSHLTIGISNTVSGSYLNLVAYLEHNGLSGSDVSFQTLGSATVLVSALNSGKVQAIANDPPITVQPNSITIQYGHAAPIDKEVNFFLDAGTGTIKSHSDAVQAFVTASVRGWQYARTHAAASLKAATPYFVAAAITSPEEIDYIVSDQLSLVTNSPAITRSGLAALRQVVNDGSPTQLTVPMSSFVVNTFVNRAITSLGLKVPKG